MELIVLGSGGFTPEPGGQADQVRSPAGYAVKLGREVLLFDLGFGNVRQLFKAGIDPSSVSHVFFTHRHPDHVGDLPALLFHYRYSSKPCSGKLHVHGPRGFCSFLNRLTRAHHPWLMPRGFTLKAQELEDGAIVSGSGWNLKVREVPHSTEAVAYRLDAKKGSLCYTGDTGLDSGLAAFAQETDVFIIECSLPDKRNNPNHLKVSQAIALFKASRARQGIFSHFSHGSYLEFSKKPPARARAAFDLMRVRIG